MVEDWGWWGCAGCGGLELVDSTKEWTYGTSGRTPQGCRTEINQPPGITNRDRSKTGTGSGAEEELSLIPPVTPLGRRRGRRRREEIESDTQRWGTEEEPVLDPILFFR